ncbi:hypothetical protein MBVG596_0678 [Mycoplasmopsis bovigenitalium]|uniref:MSC_0775 family lipoprotein n=1 Tax=Mycoplasmopsis bovigenitalium TaxID=2112 RepID=UPI00090A3824|nr:hypothetical protein [Mycoplasmopsis bovigenitalium]BAW18340.1 hypothetical protein MBVG596_0678 [Mycoplasmopsis bovigenitalium]
MKKYKRILAQLSLIAAFPFVVASCTLQEKQNSQKQDSAQQSNKLLVFDRTQNKEDQNYELYNQVYILSQINEYFENNRNYDLFKYTEGGSPETVEFKNMMANNYMYKYMKFDENQFKTIVKSKFNISDKVLNKLKFKVDYSNVYRDLGNNFDVKVPIIIRLDLENHEKANYPKGLYSQQTINVYLKNVKMTSNEEKNLKELKDSIKDIEALKAQDFTTSINIDDSHKELIQKYGINELNSKQISSIFNIQNKKFSELVEQLKAKNIELKATINKVYFDEKEPNFIRINLRIGAKHNGKEKNFNEFGFNLPVLVNIEKNEYLKQLKLAESIKVKTIVNPDINTDLSKITSDDLLVEFNNESIEKIELDKITSNNFRSASVSLNVKLKNIEKPLKLVKMLGTQNYGLLYSEEFTKNNIQAYNFEMNRLTQELLPSINKDFFGHYKSELFTGGYGTSRSFYSEKVKTPSFLHWGEDYLAPDFQPVLMPFDGELIGVYEIEQKREFEGVGTVALIKVKHDKLNLTPREREIYLDPSVDYVYIGYIHLDGAKTLNNSELGLSSQQYSKSGKNYFVVPQASPKNPISVNKNQIIGFLGNNASNGGWMSHAHVNFYARIKKSTTENYFTKDTRTDISDKRLKDYLNFSDQKNVNYIIHNIGVFGNVLNIKNDVVYPVDPKTGEKIKNSKAIESEILYYKKSLSKYEQEVKRGYSDPNIIFKLRDQRTLSFSVDDTFNIKTQ